MGNVPLFVCVVLAGLDDGARYYIDVFLSRNGLYVLEP